MKLSFRNIRSAMNRMAKKMNNDNHIKYVAGVADAVMIINQMSQKISIFRR